jgi:hypothetical protein
MFYCDDLTRENGKPRRGRCQHAPAEQGDMGLVA